MKGQSSAKARRNAERVMAALDSISERATKPRQEIAERLIALCGSGEAFTADRLFADMREGGSGVGRATVYRTIEKLVELKLVDRVDFSDGDRWYRVCSSEHHHHHLTCRRCHRVVEIDLCLPEQKLLAIGIREKFTIEDHEITLFGICDACRKAECNVPAG
jgi:Fur family transcriptional regulator, ferric uptake regulator